MQLIFISKQMKNIYNRNGNNRNENDIAVTDRADTGFQVVLVLVTLVYFKGIYPHRRHANSSETYLISGF